MTIEAQNGFTDVVIWASDRVSIWRPMPYFTVGSKSVCLGCANIGSEAARLGSLERL